MTLGGVLRNWGLVFVGNFMGAFTVAALSMIGVPPAAGFFSKWYLLLGAIEVGNGWFVAVILLSSLLNAAYFFRVLENVYAKTQPPEKNDPARLDPPASMLATRRCMVMS